MAKPRVFVDLDGVVVDFDAFKRARDLTGDQVKSMPGAYLDMEPIPGAIEAVRSLIGMGFEVWIATKPPTAVPHAYSDKAAWVLKHLPELKRRIIITHDKGLLGGADDYLCDDRPHKANCGMFQGKLIPFIDGFHWPDALAFFRSTLAGQPLPCVSSGVAERPAAYMPFATFEDRVIALPRYAGGTEAQVQQAVLDGARKEGYTGTAEQRLQQLGWTIRPVYDRP